MRTAIVLIGCATSLSFSASPIALANEVGIVSCFQGEGFHPSVVERVKIEMSHPETFAHIQTRIDTGFDNGKYSGKHFLEMHYGGSDVAEGLLSGRAIATISVEDCSVGLFQANAPK